MSDSACSPDRGHDTLDIYENQDGIRFQGLHYIDTTLAAYIGEAVTLRCDPRDAAEVRVFYRDRFLCRAICPEIAGTIITLQDRSQSEKTTPTRPSC